LIIHSSWLSKSRLVKTNDCMNAIGFISFYERFIMELEVIVKEECKPAIEVLRDQDPHDLISPDTWFTSDYCARGYVYSLFLNECRKINK